MLNIQYQTFDCILFLVMNTNEEPLQKTDDDVTIDKRGEWYARNVRLSVKIHEDASEK